MQIQPQVKITDKDGKPMVNKRVIALSWVEPQFRSIDGSKINPSNLKYFSLENVISEPSNNDGIALFQNLTIRGTAESHAYIHFYWEGRVTPWTNKVVKRYLYAIQPPRSINPIFGQNLNLRIDILNDIERSVKEGSEFLDNKYTLMVREERSLKPFPDIIRYFNILK